jgi:hypothetical protein
MRLLRLLALVPLLAAGCNSGPSNPLIGSWKLTGDGTADKLCGVFVRLKVTHNTLEWFNSAGVSGGQELQQFVVEPPNVFSTNGTAVNAISFTMQGKDSVIWHSTYGPCTFTRE